MRKLALALTIATLTSGCSIYQAVSQPGSADLEGIGVGTPRQTLITRLGPPKVIDTTKDGLKQDMFEFKSGFHQATKARAILYLAGDVFTLGLAEILFWPMEMTFMKEATCTGFATYDDKFKVVTWGVSSKSDASAQDC